MSFRLKSGEPPAVGIRRIAWEEIDGARSQLQRSDDRDKGIHEARKHFKKMRAVLRLVRGPIGDECYRRENAFYRDLGRQLAPLRESTVLVETLDSLLKRYRRQLVQSAFTGIREVLVQRQASVRAQLPEAGDRLSAINEALCEARARVDAWPLRVDDFALFRHGFGRIYRQGRTGMRRAYQEPSTETFHEWRKRAKYLWYHLSILQPLWPQLTKALANTTEELSELLGDEHDLAELAGVLRTDETFDGESQEVQLLLALIAQRRQHLRDAARPLGERIYIEKPPRFLARMEAYWQVYITMGR